MKKYNYIKLSRTKKLRYLVNCYKKKLYLIFLPGFMSDIDGEKPTAFRKYAKKFLKNIPIIVATSYGGCFGVTRNAIKKHKKSFYYSLLKTVNHHNNPIESHYLERLWCYIFSRNKYLKNAYYDVLKTKIERHILQKT